MFGSIILDVAIGLVLVYLILSMICSTANELVVSIAKSRSKLLEKGVSKLLAGMRNPQKPREDMTAAFYAHPMIASLARKGCRPSYIPARNFVLALLDLLAPADGTGTTKSFENIRSTVEALPLGGGRRALLLLLDNAENDVEKLKKEIEQWFNDAMNRVSGWYKYHTQWRIFSLGLLVAIILNVDTFNIAGSLYRDGTLRAAVTSAAERATQRPLNRPDSTMSVDSLGSMIVELQGQLDALDLPIGWPDAPSGAPSRNTFQRIALFFAPLSIPDILKVVFGWILTALAISLGAPFWFDMLGNIMNVRIAGKRPNNPANASTSSTKPG